MPRALQAKQAREVDKKTVLGKSTAPANPLSSTHCCPYSALFREVAASVSDEGSPPCRRVSGQRLASFPIIKALMPPLSRRARQMRLPMSYKPGLTHRSKTVPPRPRNLLPSMTTGPPPSDETAATAADHPTKLISPSIEQPKPRTGISSLLSLPSHPLHGASPAGIARPTFSTRSTDDHSGARRREPPPSPTARSAVSQPPPAALGGGDSEAARVSLWAEMKDIRRRGARTPGVAREQPPSSP